MKLSIKNMVCHRCIMAVQSVFEKHRTHPVRIDLGEVQLQEETLSESTLREIDLELNALGFQRIDDRKARVIEKIKTSIINRIHHNERVDVKFNWSSLLADELHLDYNYLSSLFSSVEGITLEHYIIKQKIERVKELLHYDELNMSEVADKLGYSSVQHLSSQFKKITGFTPSQFKKSHPGEHSRKNLDAIQ